MLLVYDGNEDIGVVMMVSPVRTSIPSICDAGNLNTTCEVNTVHDFSVPFLVGL